MSTATATKERPILFSGPMVRAILEGRKTQTRRALKVQPIDVIENKPRTIDEHRCWTALYEKNPPKGKLIYPLWGDVGDVLWVKETWGVQSNASAFNEDDGSVTITYAADGETRYVNDYSGDVEVIPASWTIPKAAKRGNVTPLFMPRWASRLLLRITDVRVQRAHKITDADVRAEGVAKNEIDKWRQWLDPRDVHGHAFGELWDSINGKGEWAKNPWVWAITFERVGNQEATR